MSSRSGQAWCFAVVAILMGTNLDVSRGQQYQTGDHVLVVAEAKLGAAGQEDSDQVVPGLILKVENTNNQWLWVTHEKSGWLDRAHVIPVNQAAIERLTALISDSPESDVLRRARGLLRGRFGQYEGSLEDLKEALRLKPTAETYNARGRIYAENGKQPEAIADFTASLKLRPDHAEVLNNRAHALLFSEKFAQAIKDFNKTIELNPKYSFAFMGRGLAYRGQGEYAKALADYDQAQKLDPDYPAPYKYRALLRAACPEEKLRDGRQAVQDAIRGCEQTRWQDASYLDALAAAYAESGDYQQAAQWQSRALSQRPGDRREEYQQRLNLYREGKPYREGAK